MRNGRCAAAPGYTAGNPSGKGNMNSRRRATRSVAILQAAGRTCPSHLAAPPHPDTFHHRHSRAQFALPRRERAGNSNSDKHVRKKGDIRTSRPRDRLGSRRRISRKPATDRFEGFFARNRPQRSKLSASTYGPRASECVPWRNFSAETVRRCQLGRRRSRRRPWSSSVLVFARIAPVRLFQQAQIDCGRFLQAAGKSVCIVPSSAEAGLWVSKQHLT